MSIPKDEDPVYQVTEMLRGTPGAEDFDVETWVENWMTKPVPALGGETPASYMDTPEGRRLVVTLLAMMQSGAYA